MAGIVLGAQSSLPGYFKQQGGRVSDAKPNPLVTSFEKDLTQVLSSLKKAEKKKWPTSWEFYQKVSNALFNVWNSYEAKLPGGYYTAQLLATGDLVFKKGLYQLASVHCYGRCLTSLGVHSGSQDLVSTLQEEKMDTITAILRATIGDVMCQFYIAEEKDPAMMLLSTRAKTLSVLRRLQQVSQVGLSREPLYWLVYNVLLLTYTLSRTMIKYGYSGLVLEYLLWGAVCMESSVPLMALKYLHLRVNFYVAACQCYWDMRQPHHAELFARRGLGKVHELAQLEHQSSTEAIESSEVAFREASIKMSVMVFKRSALESRKKTKSVLRPKLRPTIKDLLQAAPSPRSPTEKLLFEIFEGHSAQFLAMLEFLSDSSRRPLEQAPPSPITELDNDTVTDVYQELFCIGTELSLDALREIKKAIEAAETADSAAQQSLHQYPSLMTLASRGGGRVPLDAVVWFIRLARSYNQKEVVDMLAEPTISLAKLSEDELYRNSGAALELILATDSLHSVHKKYKSRISAVPAGGQPTSAVGGPPPAHPPHSSHHPPPPTTAAGTNTTGAGSSGQQTAASVNEEGGTAEELFDKLQHVLTLLHSATVNDITTPAGHALPLVSMDFDLLLDVLVIVWEVARPALARINSHSYSSCRQFLSHSTGKQYLQLLVQLVEVSQSLQLWQTDPLLHGELHLKLACLYEAKAEVRGHDSRLGGSKPVSNITLVGGEGGFSQLYDRAQLLECLSELELGLKCVKMARAEMMAEEARRRRRKGVEQEGAEITVLHSEYMFSITRVKVKLASTIPPPPPPESTQKLSSLKSKVKEREERQRQRERMLSELTAPTVAVANESQLREESGKNLWSTALVLMLEASTTPRLDREDRERLIKESFSYLLQEQQRLSELENATPSSTSISISSPLSLSPPILQFSTDESMTFIPPSFANPKLQDSVAYYKLFGRVASGSNVKVRLTDKNLPGLGVEVPAQNRCDKGETGAHVTLKVKGLQVNESYVFAVAAYGQRGELIGGSIGATGRPIVACYRLSMLMLWGYCCQCAYKAGVGSIANKASVILWKHFIHPKDSDHTLKEEEQFQFHSLDKPLLSTTPTAILRHFIESIIVHVQLSMSQGYLLSDQLCVTGPLKPSQLQRLKLVSRLFTAVQVAGMINDPSLCLQAVVLCFGLVAPMVQHSIVARPLLEVLLYCHAVLVELPEQVLIGGGKDSSATASLHHIVAATAYYIGKVVHAAQKKPLFTSFTTNARGLLLCTMQAATSVAKEMERDGRSKEEKEKEDSPPPYDGDLHRPSLLPDSQDAALASYAAVHSSLGQILPPKVTEKKKKGRKKLIAAADQLSDEAKSSEYKAFEAFLISTHSHQQGIDDFDLTGQEDPVILHAVIANLTSQQAYKEVHKFRRRPQYLEYLVHLCTLTVAKGGQERVMGWINDAFHWLKKRNELLLSPKTLPVKPPPAAGGGGGGGHAPHQKTRTVSARGSATALAQAKTTAGRRTSLTAVGPHTTGTTAGKGHTIGAKESKDLLRTAKSKEGATTTKVDASVSKGILAVSSQHTTGQKKQLQIARKPSAMGKRLAPVTSRNLDVSLSVKITRDDIEYKAHILVATLLPELWRKHKCRKRLRAVCVEDMPWRAQANLIQASCCLGSLLGRLEGQSSNSASKGPTDSHLKQHHGVTFDVAGVIIDGVLPIHSPAVAGAEGKPSRSKGGKLSSSLEVVAISEVQVIMRHLQRAVVLASRGRHWTLLQNAARSLWNTINTLLQACFSSGLDEVRRESIVAAVYGLAMKPLYFTAVGLTDLLASLEIADSAKPLLPTVTSLRFTESVDDCSAVGLLLIKQVVYLAVHTLYVHQHWEKMINIAVNFDDVTRHSWADELVPVIISAQSKLAVRLSQHQPHAKNNTTSDPTTTAERGRKIHPAAHLDPGPDGYNIYGKSGHSFALTSVPLDTKLSMDRLQDQSSKEGERALNSARSMLSRYCAAQVDQKLKNDSAEAKTESLACPSVPLTGVSSVVSAYDEAISKLLKSGQKELVAQAMSELGDVLWHSGHSKTAGHWWREVLSTVIGATQQDWPVPGASGNGNWRKLIEGEGVEDGGEALSRFGVWGCLLAAINATKLARYTCCGALDVRLEYTLLSASLFRCVLAYSLPHPIKDLDYISYHLPHSSPEGSRLTPGMEIFADVHRCNPLALLASLQWTAHELIQRKHSVKVLPVLWLYDHLSHKVCRNVTHTATARLLKLQLLTQLSQFDDALLCLSELLTGSDLPSTATHHDRQVDSHWSPLKFNTGAPISDAKNIKYLQYVMERGLSAKLEQLYGRELVGMIAVARAQLYTSLAATATYVTPPIASRSSVGKSTGAPQPPTTRSTKSGSPRSSAPSSPGSTRPSETNNTLMKRIKSDIKLMLLVSAEKELTSAWSDSPTGSDINTRSYLAMAEVSLALSQPSTAAQLCLAALRSLQSTNKSANLSSSQEMEENLKSIRLNSQSSFAPDLRLWLECKNILAKSLMDVKFEWLSCASVCGEACEECEACGDVEMWAEFHLTAALHSLNADVLNLDLIQVHAQSGLELLNSLREQTPYAQLLSTKLSLILSDASCLQTSAVLEEMIPVYSGLTAMLNKQMTELSIGASTVNIYQPHRVLMASCKLRLAHTLTLMASTKTANNDRGDLITSAMAACEDGLQLLKDSAYTKPPLEAELKFQYGIAHGLQSNDGENFNFTPLLEAVKTLSGQGLNHRLLFTNFCELASLYSASSKRPKPFYPKTPKTPGTGDTPPAAQQKSLKTSTAGTLSNQEPVLQRVPSPRRPSVSRMSNKPPSQEQDRVSKAEREWNRERGRENYLAWCMVKCAAHSLSASQQLTVLASELRNEEVTKRISDKVLDDLPDFVLLDLCPSENLLQMLATDVHRGDAPPIEAMLPSTQHADTTNLTWFKIIGYFNYLLQHCFWQKNALSTTASSPWLLHYNEFTPCAYSKCKSLLTFLLQNCPPFKTCRLPATPPLLSLSPAGQRASGGSHSAAIQQADTYLSAADNELSVIWTSPFLAPLASKAGTNVSCEGETEKAKISNSEENALSGDDIVMGYFVLNQRAVRTSIPSNLSSFGFESYIIKMPSKKLSELHTIWQDLAAASKSILMESRSSSRPLSRSPSKQKKLEKPFRIPSELVESLELAVINLAEALGLALTRDQIPKLELQNVSTIAQVLRPFGNTTVKGEACCFFKSLFNTSQ